MNEGSVRAFWDRFFELTIYYIGPALGETLYMTMLSAALAMILGFMIAIVLIMSGPHGLRPNQKVYSVFDFAVNLLRSFPFIILLILVLLLILLLVLLLFFKRF